MEELERRLARACRYLLTRSNEQWARIGGAVASSRIRGLIARRQQRVDELQFCLESAWRRECRKVSEGLQEIESRLLRQDVTHRLRVTGERLGRLEGRLDRAQRELLVRLRSSLASGDALLQSLSPLAVLKRGYALVFEQSGALVKDALAVPEGSLVTVRLANGELRSRVVERKTRQNA